MDNGSMGHRSTGPGMKVALLIQNTDRRKGGTEGYTLDLARALAVRGHQVTVIAEEGPEAVAQGAPDSGFTCMYVGVRGRYRWTRLKNFLGRLEDVYAHGAYDIVHAMLPVWRCDVYQPHAGLATELWLSGHLKYPRGIVRRWARRFNRWNLKRRGLARVERHLLERRPWVLCLSQAMRRFAARQFALPEERLVMLMNGIDLARFDPAPGARSRAALRAEWRIAADQPLALFVGHDWKRKGVAEAIEALAGVRDRRLALMIVGGGAPREYQKLARRLKVEPRVLFIDRVADPRPFYGAADFLLLPTREDTCSLVVLEALAMGLPVVTTRQNGASEMIQNGTQGLIVERGDAGGLVAALESMLEAGRLAEMSRAALALREELSFDRHVERIVEVYERVLGERRKAEGVAGGVRG